MTLARQGDAAAAEPLLTVIEDPAQPAIVRATAAELTALLPDPYRASVLTQLAPLATDASPLVRIGVIRALAELPEASKMPLLAPLLAPSTVVLPAINGLPWWYFHCAGGPLDGTAVRSLDPEGCMLADLDGRHVLGCVVHIAAEVRAPLEVHHTGGRRLIVGEPDRSDSARLQAVCAVLAQAGFDAVAARDIRFEVWWKLIGNLSFNPVAALTGYLMDAIIRDAGALEVIRAVMREGMAVCAHYGYPMPMSPDERIDVARQLGAAKISMLQDIEQRRRLELDAIVGSVIELAQRAGLEVPATRMIYALTTARARALGIEGH